MKKNYSILITAIFLGIVIIAVISHAQTETHGVGFMGGATVETPRDVAGLYAWWDASDGRVIDTTAPSNSFSSITDMTGNGHHLTQGTKANQPSLLSLFVNGRDVMSFATDDRLLGTDSITNVFAGNDIPFSFFQIIQVNAQNNETSMAWGNNTNASAQFIVHRPDIGSGANSVFRATRSDDTATAVNGNINGSTNGFWMIQVHSFSGTTFTSRLVSNITNVFNSGTLNVGPTTVNTFAMGALSRNGSFAQHLNGQIAEMGIYSRDMTTNEQNTIIRYARQKYGINPP